MFFLIYIFIDRSSIYPIVRTTAVYKIKPTQRLTDLKTVKPAAFEPVLRTCLLWSRARRA